MRLARVRNADGWISAVDHGQGWRRVSGVNPDDIVGLVRSVGPTTTGDPLDVPSHPISFGSPVMRPGKIIAIGLNYADHIRETGATAPENPIIFAKFPSAIVGPYDEVVIDPDLTSQGDYESELAVVIGRRARRVTESAALAYVFGYLVGNDVSARDWQKRDGQLSRSKSMDTFCPLGPWITSADEVQDPNDLWIRSWVNGEQRQDSTTGQMIFSIAELISYCTRTMTLEPGDVILTGTPHGVGFAMNPPAFLHAGDLVRCEVEGLGSIENRIVGS